MVGRNFLATNIMRACEIFLESLASLFEAYERKSDRSARQEEEVDH
jgi:hypothetical protein